MYCIDFLKKIIRLLIIDVFGFFNDLSKSKFQNSDINIFLSFPPGPNRQTEHLAPIFALPSEIFITSMKPFKRELPNWYTQHVGLLLQ